MRTRTQLTRLVFRLIVRGALLATVPLMASAQPASAQPIKSAGWLGVAMERDKSAPGATVRHVVRGSPAARAGMKDGDRIFKVDGLSTATPADVTNVVSSHAAGQNVMFDIMRDGFAIQVQALLAARPSADQVFRMELVGQKLPPLPKLTIASGPGPVAYPALNGRVVLLDLFATWCGPCLLLGPYYHAMHEKYGPLGLTVLAVSPEDVSLLAKWGTKNSVPYTIAHDPTDDLSSRLGAPALPSSVIIDKHGVVREVSVGFDLAQVKRTEAVIQALLKEP